MDIYWIPVLLVAVAVAWFARRRPGTVRWGLSALATALLVLAGWGLVSSSPPPWAPGQHPTSMLEFRGGLYTAVDPRCLTTVNLKARADWPLHRVGFIATSASDETGSVGDVWPFGGPTAVYAILPGHTHASWSGLVAKYPGACYVAYGPEV